MKKIILVILILLVGRLENFGQAGYIGGIEVLDNGALAWAETAIISAANSLTIVGNIRKLNKVDKYKSNAGFWILTGAFQSLIGVGMMQDKKEYKNADTRTQAGINIGVGLATITASIIRLASKSPPKEDKVSYNFYYSPHSNTNPSIVGLHLALRFN